MTVTLYYRDFRIELFDDPAYLHDSGSEAYDQIYWGEGSKDYTPVSKHAITIYQDNVKFANAILLRNVGY